MPRLKVQMLRASAFCSALLFALGISSHASATLQAEREQRRRHSVKLLANLRMATAALADS
jgi:hypothetical protein